MNHPSEWTKFYHPKYGRYFYKHKGTGVITDTLFKIGNAMKKPLINLAKNAGKKVAEKGIDKVSNVVVKKAGDKIENVLRKRAASKVASKAASKVMPKVKQSRQPTNTSFRHQDLIKLNNLIAQL